MPQFDAGWLAALRARAQVPPLRPRVPLLHSDDVIGSVLPDLYRILGHWPTADGHSSLSIEEQTGFAGISAVHLSAGWRIEGPLTHALRGIAVAMRDARVGHVAQHWRNEALAVYGSSGARLGEVERGAVRALGIATRAVHLVGFTPDGRVWVQQRAFNKANDPGLWDTLMGGMVSGADTVATALVRETWEEAGLHLGQLQAVERGGCVTIRRPTGEADDDGIGYVIEDTDWYRCTVPDGMMPVNQDGEVEQFLLLEPSNLVARLERNEFTLEAALILVAALGH